MLSAPACSSGVKQVMRSEGVGGAKGAGLRISVSFVSVLSALLTLHLLAALCDISGLGVISACTLKQIFMKSYFQEPEINV